ncbi:LytR/AlgR family response regulator transcription factor [Sandaracinobacteroides saxicola]|uniref:LytTR family transcriptional regulator n=1 Tax=Sandaracinobacteroides saxicola TaxID=2759707 RepID=A0A7G5ILQ0_9SPHN|nr:LytTR family DNA-binding domain-containing protein [Sandaracinobacteroides saxicola]QMW24292.1 LytTR family transcriptional regulator [Sandaracinobacteroides saxicola]
MTNGGDLVTNGDRPYKAVLTIGVALILFVAVSISSMWTEIARGEMAGPLWMHATWEISSLIAMLPLLLPAARIACRIEPWPLARRIAAHVVLSIAFSLLHSGGMVLIRKAVHSWMDSDYRFLEDGALLVFFYEWRKDALVYAALVVLLGWLRARAPVREAPARLAFAVGGVTHLIGPHEIRLVKAAGNYCELILDGRTLLVRSTLGAMLARLAPFGFRRVHRGVLIHPSRIRALAATASGDTRATLDDGDMLLISRRYPLPR